MVKGDPVDWSENVIVRQSRSQGLILLLPDTRLFLVLFGNPWLPIVAVLATLLDFKYRIGQENQVYL